MSGSGSVLLKLLIKSILYGLGWSFFFYYIRKIHDGDTDIEYNKKDALFGGLSYCLFTLYKTFITQILN